MTNLSISHDNFLISNDIVKTTSMQVASVFGKRHTHVTDKLKALDCSDEFRSANFSAHPYINEQNGERYTLWEMTKDGFMFLVMGFTGKKAARIKEAYINSFNQMAELLKPKTLSPAHKRAIQNAVAKKVDHNRPLYPKVWGAIKNHFQVGTYKELPDSSFDLVLTFVQNFKLTALPAPEINEDERSLAAFRRGRSAGIRRHAEQAAEWLRRVGQGHNDHRATYNGSRMINLEDIKNIRNAREELFKMENLLLNFNIENDPFQSKEQIIRSVMNG